MTRFGLIGLGTMGRNHLRVLSNLDGVELVAVCDQNAAMLQAAFPFHLVGMNDLHRSSPVGSGRFAVAAAHDTL